MAKTFYALMIVLCLFSSVLTSVAPQQIYSQIYYDPEYVFLPPAEIIYFSVDAVKGDEYTSLGFRMTMYSFELGDFYVETFATYSEADKLCWSGTARGSGAINIDGFCSREAGYYHIITVSYVMRDNKWVPNQDIHIYGIGRTCPYSAKAEEISLKAYESAHNELGGIVIRTMISAPAENNIIRIRIYKNDILVYDLTKTVKLPSIWAYSKCKLEGPLEGYGYSSILVDFGPLSFKKSGPYTIRIDATSGDKALSYSLIYEQPGWVTITIDNPYGTAWNVAWTGGATGTRAGVGSDSWSIWATSLVSLRAEVRSPPFGYSCAFSPNFITAEPGEEIKLKVDCVKVEKTRTETQTVEYLREYTRTVTAYVTKPIVETVTATVEKTVATTVTAQAIEANLPIILSIVAIAIAVAFSVTSLIALRKRVGQQ